MRVTAWMGVCLGVVLLGVAKASGADPIAPFGPGEQVRLSISYLGISAGSTLITVGASTKPGERIWPIVGLADSGALLGFYPVHDRMVSYWNATTRTWAGSKLAADENHHRRRMTIEVHGETADVVRQKEGGPVRRSKMKLPTGTLDLFSTLYGLRTRPLKVGQTYEIPICTGAHILHLRAKVVGHQQMDTALGKRSVVRVEVQTGLSGSFASKKALEVYFTTDPHHIPVRIVADLALGSIVANLTEYAPGEAVAARDTPSTPG